MPDYEQSLLVNLHAWPLTHLLKPTSVCRHRISRPQEDTPQCADRAGLLLFVVYLAFVIASLSAGQSGCAGTAGSHRHLHVRLQHRESSSVIKMPRSV